MESWVAEEKERRECSFQTSEGTPRRPRHLEAVDTAWPKPVSTYVSPGHPAYQEARHKHAPSSHCFWTSHWRVFGGGGWGNAARENGQGGLTEKEIVVCRSTLHCFHSPQVIFTSEQSWNRYFPMYSCLFDLLYNESVLIFTLNKKKKKIEVFLHSGLSQESAIQHAHEHLASNTAIFSRVWTALLFRLDIAEKSARVIARASLAECKPRDVEITRQHTEMNQRVLESEITWPKCGYTFKENAGEACRV